MAYKRYLWSTDLMLATFERSDDLIIGYVMANIPNMHNLGSPTHPNGLEEAPVVHQPGLGQFGEVG